MVNFGLGNNFGISIKVWNLKLGERGIIEF